MKVLFSTSDDPAEGGAEMTLLHHLTQGFAGCEIETVFTTIGELRACTVTSVSMRIWHAGLRNLYRPDLRVCPFPQTNLYT